MKMFRAWFRFSRSERGNEAVQTVAILTVAATVLLGLLSVGRMVQERGREQLALVLAGGEKSGFASGTGYLNAQTGGSGTDGPTAMSGSVPYQSSAIAKSDGSPSALDWAVPGNGTPVEQPSVTPPSSSPPETGNPTPAEPIIDPPAGTEPNKPRRGSKDPEETDPTDPAVEDPSKNDPALADPRAKKLARKGANGSSSTTTTDPAVPAGSEVGTGIDTTGGLNGMTGTGGQNADAGGAGNSGFPGGGYSGAGNSGMGVPNAGFGNQGGYPPYGQNGGGYPNNGYPNGGNSNNGYGAIGFGMEGSTQDSASSKNRNSSSKKKKVSEEPVDEHEVKETAHETPPGKSGHQLKDRADNLARAASTAPTLKLDSVVAPLQEIVNPGQSAFLDAVGVISAEAYEEFSSPQDPGDSPDMQRSFEPDLIYATQAQISIIGVDRTQPGISRLKLAVGEQFEQLQVEAGKRHWAFKAPPAGSACTIPLSDTFVPPGTRIVLIGITKHSQLAVNYEVPDLVLPRADTALVNVMMEPEL